MGRYGESFLSHPTRPVVKAMARRYQAQNSSTPEMVKEEEVDVARNLIHTPTRSAKRPRKPSATFDDYHYTLQELEAHPLSDEIEFQAQYIAGYLADHNEDETQMSTFDSQWCKKLDAKEALRRGEAITKYLHQKIAALGCASPSRRIPTAIIASTTSTPSTPFNPSTPTPPAKRAALKPSASQPMAMWTPNLSRDALSAPSGFVLSDGRPAPRLR
ncbi:hypothetical protein CVT26_015185 [Gymnopilus dilepis]|uniref:Uncharacterized protein n=1 Tax=Gymnopilus dilepis TaxID=231916 RepID=A0A409W9Z9_9AGAR|nr:hypothetical protein CVT26_015185 [Gymnopilus dilepis]